MRIAVTGAAGQLGLELCAIFRAGGHEVIGLSRPEFDITRASDLEGLAAQRPDVVVNCAAWTDVDGCARDPARAMAINGTAAGAIAHAAARAGALAVQISTNEVFDGAPDRTYAEEDEPHPINPYGASKLSGEHAVAAANDRHLIVRTAWVFGGVRANFVTKIRAAAERARERGEALRVVEDEMGNPTPTAGLGSALGVLINRCREDPSVPHLYHVAGEPPVSRLDWAREILKTQAMTIEPMRLADYKRDSIVPQHAVLSCARAAAVGVPPIAWREYLTGMEA